MVDAKYYGELRTGDVLESKYSLYCVLDAGDKSVPTTMVFSPLKDEQLSLSWVARSVLCLDIDSGDLMSDHFYAWRDVAEWWRVRRCDQ